MAFPSSKASGGLVRQHKRMAMGQSVNGATPNVTIANPDRSIPGSPTTREMPESERHPPVSRGARSMAAQAEPDHGPHR